MKEQPADEAVDFALTGLNQSIAVVEAEAAVEP